MDSPYSLEVDALFTRNGLDAWRAEELISCRVNHHAVVIRPARNVHALAATQFRRATNLDLEPAATD